MHRIRPVLATLLAAVLLLTLLSPHFGWEVAAADTIGASQSAGEGRGTAVTEADHGCDDTADRHHHHCCAGHQFSHTPAQVSAAPDWFPALIRQRALPGDSDDFRSFIPSGLDRPPTQVSV